MAARVNVMDLEKYLDKRIRVTLSGGRTIVGKLMGFDGLVNLVLDDSIELLRDPSDATILTEVTRYVGLVVARGPVVTVVAPEEGLREIENPCGAGARLVGRGIGEGRNAHARPPPLTPFPSFVGGDEEAAA